MKVKVRLDGMVAMIHEAEGFANQVKYVSQGLGQYYHHVCIHYYHLPLRSHPRHVAQPRHLVA